MVLQVNGEVVGTEGFEVVVWILGVVVGKVEREVEDKDVSKVRQVLPRAGNCSL